VAPSPGGNHIVGVLMLVRPQSRLGSALWAMVFSAILALASLNASANPLDEQSCQRLRTERQALTVLGIDKHVEKGASWAKERLTVADLNLVKRYLDVYEQIKFRCEKIVALVEPDEKDEDDDDHDAAGGALPPLPERKGPQPVKSSAVPAASPATPAVSPATPAVSPETPAASPQIPQIESNSAAKAARAPLGAANISGTQIGPTLVAPVR
jgi:hypothetical protein